MLKVLRAELIKLPWLLVGGIALAGPAFSVLLGGTDTGEGWASSFGNVAVAYSWLFYPLLAGVFAALICRVEHATGGWKLTLTLPVRRTHVYLAKYIVLAGVLALTNLVFGAAFLVAGTVAGIQGAVPYSTIGMALLSGWVAVLPLAALQLWVSSRWKSFGAALALNVCLTLPSIFAAQSRTIGPWYPWAQPMLAMSSSVARRAGDSVFNVSPTTLWVVVAGGLIVAIAGGLFTFTRADIRQ
ncbi:MAG TPA: ABC transporter permease [Coriobacteriia bacterium]